MEIAVERNNCTLISLYLGTFKKVMFGIFNSNYRMSYLVNDFYKDPH
jgi:hypothetical protein